MENIERTSALEPQRFYSEQSALDAYNKIFETSLSGDFEGGLEVKIPKGILRIFASGEVVTFIPNEPTHEMVSYPSDNFDLVRYLFVTDKQISRPVVETTWTTTEMSKMEVVDAATGLLVKHEDYLRLVFHPQPRTMVEAVYRWTLLLESCMVGEKVALTPEVCRKLFARAVEKGYQYHMEVCSKHDVDDKPLCCQLGKVCGVALENGDSDRQSYELTEDEAKVLSDFLKPQDRESKEYTVEAIVKSLCRAAPK